MNLTMCTIVASFGLVTCGRGANFNTTVQSDPVLVLCVLAESVIVRRNELRKSRALKYDVISRRMNPQDSVMGGL